MSLILFFSFLPTSDQQFAVIVQINVKNYAGMSPCIERILNRQGKTLIEQVFLMSLDLFKANQKYRGMFETQKSLNKTSSREIGLNITTYAIPKWDRTRCPEE